MPVLSSAVVWDGEGAFLIIRGLLCQLGILALRADDLAMEFPQFAAQTCYSLDSVGCYFFFFLLNTLSLIFSSSFFTCFSPKVCSFFATAALLHSLFAP